MSEKARKRIRLQLMWDRLIAVVEEQAQAILKTAFGSVVREAGDLSTGIYDLQGRMLAQAVTGTPGHVNTMAKAVSHFLERFPVTFEQAYPSAAIEMVILQNTANELGVDNEDFCKRLVDWADVIRKTFFACDGTLEEIVSTRRLVHIIRAYAIFNDKQKALEMCLNRFDDHTKSAFMELYDKVDADFNLDVNELS